MTTENLVHALCEVAEENPCACLCEECYQTNCMTPLLRAAAFKIDLQTAKIKELEAKVPRWIPVTERLTYFENGKWRMDFNGCQYQANFVDRLAAYEDTGLTPGEIKSMQEEHFSSLATKLICDRCGAEINPMSSVTYVGVKNSMKDNGYELCVSCAHKLREWFKGETEGNDG